MPDDQVVLLDVNALVALALTSHQHHRAAHAFLQGVRGSWATCPTTEAGVLRLLLNPAVTGRQHEAGEVLGILAGMRHESRWTFLEDVASLAKPVIDTVVLTGHQQVTDLQLVNLAAQHGAVLATFDSALRTWLAPQDRDHVLVIPD